MADGFLGRWAKRKEAVRRGEVISEEPQGGSLAPLPSPPPSPASGRGSLEAVAPPPLRGEGGGEGRPATEPPPTLEEAQSLTPDSDFTRFARPDVPVEVKNTAFRKLFSDPHFNVMDGLDVYIDDYSKPDPLPPQMLRQLASAQFLRLFEEKEDKPHEQPEGTGESADHGAAQNVAESGSRRGDPLPPAEPHADPDLRLQQDDAPGPAGPGAGAG